MDKKTKRRLEVLRKKLHGVEKLLADARRQPDDLNELASLEKQATEIRAEIETLKAK